ncbi:MAG: pyridoxamine 5'-phosphate oxidase family protein [Nocardioides sp.]|nr:pyridoxamine 5'-phosphate oxidase family protein [Nocardioides sp.]
MHHAVELSVEECRARLTAGTVGRVAYAADHGLRIVPVNYTVSGDAVYFRTSAYGELGTHAPRTEIAFEIDELDHQAHQGWSVLATGTAEVVEDIDDVPGLRDEANPQPWAAGSRLLYFRLRWRELTGRRVGPG